MCANLTHLLYVCSQSGAITSCAVQLEHFSKRSSQSVHTPPSRCVITLGIKASTATLSVQPPPFQEHLHCDRLHHAGMTQSWHAHVGASL